MKFLTLEQFTEMWKLQDELNTVITPNWKEQNYNWNLYIKAEIMEFFEYVGYKHWKTPDQTKKPSDMQARLELVDIWHFLLSSIIEISNTHARSEHERFTDYVQGSVYPSPDTQRNALTWLDNGSKNNVSKVLCLADALIFCDWTWDELYKAYIGKVALNNFRQANGYKEGNYQKIWDASMNLEDNYFLEHIMKLLSEQGTLTYSNVYDQLELRYSVVPY